MKITLIILLTLIIALIGLPAIAVNRVLSLDGDGDYVQVPDAESLDVTANFTFEAWIFPTAASGVNTIFNKEESYQWAIVYGSLRWELNPSGGWSWYDTRIAVPVNQWIHLALTYDAKNVSVYGNGLLLSTITHLQGGNLDVGDSALWIGGRSLEAVSFFTGLIDEARIWNRVRTQEEIQATMHTTLSGKEPGLVGYWQFDALDDKIAADASESHSDGELMGDAYVVETELPKPGEVVLPTVLWGLITNELGQPIPNASVRLEQGGSEIARTRADAFGNYQIASFHPVSGFDGFDTLRTQPKPQATQPKGLYDLSASSLIFINNVATAGDLRAWRLGIRLSEGERQKLNLTLKKAISIEGTLLMLDDATPHVAVPVQAIRNGKVIDGTLSDESGKYRFLNLKPGSYQVRCQILDGYVYYRTTDDVSRFTSYDSAMREGLGDILKVEESKTLKDIDFRFPPFKQGTWQTYTTLNGLAGNGVYAIQRDSDGMMWFGTLGGGISRYDGKHFVNLTQEDGLASNMIMSLYCDPDGMIWIGSFDSGVCIYDGQEFKNFTQKDGLGSNTIAAIYRDRDGAIWFGTGYAHFSSLWGGVSRGVYPELLQRDGQEFKTFNTTDGLAGERVDAIYQDPDGVMWFGTNGGLSRYDGKQFKTFNTKDGLAGNQVATIHRDPDGVMWFGTDSGVSRYAKSNGRLRLTDGNQFVNFTTKDGLTHNDVEVIYSDGDGVLWFGTGFGSAKVGNGVSRYDGKTFVNFTNNDGLADNSVLAIYGDEDGVLWFGTYSGLSRYDDKSFVNLTTKDGLIYNDVRAIYRDKDGFLWFGTDGGGVSRYDGKSFVNLTTRDGLVNNYVQSIHQTPDGALWFGGRWGGLSRYDGDGFVNFTDGLGFVHTMDGDPEGNLWLGTTMGIFRYDGNQFHNLTTKDGLADNGVWTIHCDPAGVIWAGTLNDGVSRYDGKQFLTLTTEDGLTCNTIVAIYGDPDGIMWFGSLGLSKYDGKEFKNFTTKDGLADNRVVAIHRDRDGVLWFGTTGGVSCYDGQTWTSLDTRDGLAGDSVFSIHEDLDGSLWFGTNGGVTRYQKSALKPKVRIASVKTDKEYTNIQALPPITTGGRVTIKYNAIDFKTVPEKRQYRYRIEGIDPDWRPPTKETSFDGSFDKPGTYTFEVQAIDRDVNYSEPASLTFHVKRPWWVYAFFGMLIAGIPLAFGGFYFGKRLQTQRAIAQQFNPYIAGRVVGEDLFYGRNDLITDIERTLHNNCFLLYGERRIGKTSLQHQLRERLQNADDPTYRFIPAYIDLQGVSEEDFFRTIAASVVEHAASLFKETLPLRLNEDRERYTYRDLSRDLRTILDHLKENETKTIKLVLLMDEVDTLNSYSLRTNLNLRGLFMGPLKENLILIMSGLYLKMDWSDEGSGSPPFNFLSREIQIQPLDEASALELITEPVKGFYTYEPKAVALIIEYSELRPFTIQGFCLRAVNRVLADGRTRITVDDIEAIKESVLAEVLSIRGERAGTSLPASLNEALALLNETQSRVVTLEAENARLRQEVA